MVRYCVFFTFAQSLFSVIVFFITTHKTWPSGPNRKSVLSLELLIKTILAHLTWWPWTLTQWPQIYGMDGWMCGLSLRKVGKCLLELLIRNKWGHNNYILEISMNVKQEVMLLLFWVNYMLMKLHWIWLGSFKIFFKANWKVGHFVVVVVDQSKPLLYNWWYLMQGSFLWSFTECGLVV